MINITRWAVGLCAGCLLWTSATAFGAATAQHPNVLLVMADQWRAQAFGYAGDPNVKTPHIDALARASVNFSNAVSSLPVCCPTRASMFTGERAITHGVFMNDLPLPSDAITLAKVLKEQGYDTGYVGKWHLSGAGRSEFIPRDRREGFDYWKVLECTHNYNNSFYYGDTPEKLEWPGYDAIAQTHDAQDYLRGRATNSRPFFFVLSWGPPHSPYQTAPPKYRALYDAAKIKLRGNVPPGPPSRWPRDAAGYYAHCTALDDCMGELMATLHETGLDKDTIVIFTADHGDMLGSHGMKAKQKPFDESIRIPLLMRCPPEMKIKTRPLDAIIASEDFMPTVLGLCHAPIPATVQGTDFSGYMRGRRDPSDDAALIWCVAPFSEYSRRVGGREFRGVRTKRYTYVRDLKGPWLLFDDQRDPLQMTNLVGQPSSAQLQARMEKVLTNKLKAAGDAFLPADDYIKKWHWPADANGNIPYTN